ncbi:MAG: hydrogenase expression/formation protein HypE [Eubacteriaceae bacterium]|uniref:Hydrogenase expression/formation protein HypE n=1 Tax=Candidatus Pseudoramibacter fermentans TaxID=2594427 RepID=A0A6L5GQM9_9FIRM|nr:hydrogenase expression/formation protein HypE [Candidatus Pseudoramibacter fermentans]RRF91868.1 MAG: hydrogenase expression/formation protein HypE [Eubacteriaceae bacterium]
MRETLPDQITLAHGAGGKQTSALIHDIFKKYFDNPFLTADDAAVLPRPDRKIAMSTDGFVVSPAFFPGGNIGELSVCGTVNDLSCMGAKPLYLTCSFIIEEGLETAKLDQIAQSMAQTAEKVGVALVAGDTKVVGKGQADQVFITTTGVGELMPGVHLAGADAKPGDAVLVTGDVGRHGCAVLLARDEYGIDAHVTSDCAPLWHPISAALEAAPDIHVIRDATRGGVGTVLYEIAHQSHVGIQLNAEDIPVDPAVAGVCGMLGLEPLYLACEGRMVMIMPQERADAVIDALSAYPDTQGICKIGVVTEDNPERVVMETAIGAQTFLPEPGTELLPRIC